MIIGPSHFVNTLNELKTFLKFNLFSNENKLPVMIPDNIDVLICHNQDIQNFKKINNLDKLQIIKILALNSKDKLIENFDHVINLPTTLNDLNKVVEQAAIKKKFHQNSSIKVKGYLLNKNEKKLIKEDKSIILTEKEIQLIELFSKKNEPLSKNLILSTVWHYSSEADTHTVETHIYRLRKKINNLFKDENFIVNTKDGYNSEKRNKIAIDLQKNIVKE